MENHHKSPTPITAAHRQRRRTDATPKPLPTTNSTVICSYSYLDGDGNHAGYRHAFDHAPNPYADYHHRAYARNTPVSVIFPEQHNRLIVFNDGDDWLECSFRGERNVDTIVIPPMDMVYHPNVSAHSVTLTSQGPLAKQGSPNMHKFRVLISEAKQR